MRRELWSRRTAPALTVGVVLVVLWTLSACAGGGGAQTLDGDPVAGSGGGTPAAPPSSPIPSTGPQGAAGAEVLRVYRGYWASEIHASATADAAGSGLQTYATDKALSDALGGVVRLQRSGLVMTGRPIHRPRVTSVDLQSDPHTATLWDCLDVTGWHQATAKGHHDADPAQRLTRYVITVQARTVGETWMISDVNRYTTQPC